MLIRHHNRDHGHADTAAAVDHLAALSVPVIASGPHDVVVMTACSRAAGAAAVPGEHLRAGPPVQLHEVTFGAAPVEEDMAEGVPKLVRVDLNASVPAAPLDHLVDAAGRHRT